MGSKGRVSKVPLEPMPIVTEPFSCVAIDLVGPISPRSAQGNRYILALIDFTTGFPEAVPLKDIDSISVAEALLQIFLVLVFLRKFCLIEVRSSPPNNERTT